MHILNRRSVQIGLATAFLAGKQVNASTEQANDFFSEGSLVPTLDEIDQLSERGTELPTKEEIGNARSLLNACKEKTPFEVAQYFANIRTGYGSETFAFDATNYCEEWEVRANPVIVGFFDATLIRKPNGDQTAWCAAFVNWCLVRAALNGKKSSNYHSPTMSAAALSFLLWGKETPSPSIGDIAVFQHKTKRGKGHVGFVLSIKKEGTWVLGGNQMPRRAKTPAGTYERKNTGEINVAYFPNDGKDLSLRSYRTRSGLND